ncbi:MAG TPA: hypothetical protein VIL18_12450 [Longimicrobiales bacterium]
MLAGRAAPSQACATGCPGADAGVVTGDVKAGEPAAVAARGVAGVSHSFLPSLNAALRIAAGTATVRVGGEGAGMRSTSPHLSAAASAVAVIAIRARTTHAAYLDYAGPLAYARRGRLSAPSTAPPKLLS